MVRMYMRNTIELQTKFIIMKLFRADSGVQGRFGCLGATIVKLKRFQRRLGCPSHPVSIVFIDCKFLIQLVPIMIVSAGPCTYIVRMARVCRIQLDAMSVASCLVVHNALLQSVLKI